MSKPLTIVLAAGGTGGHMFPAIAVGDALKARGHNVIAATDGRGQRFGAGIETENVTAGGIGGGAIGKIKGLCKIGLGAGQAMMMLRGCVIPILNHTPSMNWQKQKRLIGKRVSNILW